MSYINQVIILQCRPPSLHYCTLPNKAFISPSVRARRECIWKLNWKESLLIYFEYFQGVPCFHRQSMNRMMNTFIIVNITPICRRDSLEDKLCFLSTSKRPSPSLYLGTPFTDYCFIFKITRAFPYSYTGKIDWRMVNTLLMIKVNPTCKRLLIFICQEKNRNPGLYHQ